MDLLKSASKKLLKSAREFAHDLVKKDLDQVVEAEENEVEINEINDKVDLIIYKHQSSYG
jgi:hypothetical protein